MEVSDVLTIKEGTYLVSLTYNSSSIVEDRTVVNFKEITQSCEIFCRYSMNKFALWEVYFQVRVLENIPVNNQGCWEPSCIVAIKSNVKKLNKLESTWAATFYEKERVNTKSVYLLFNFVLNSKYSFPCGIDRVPDHLIKLWQDKLMADVTIRLKNGEVKAHRLILASGSPVFSAMFQNDCKENREGIMNIGDVDVAVMEHLLRFIYTGDADLDNAEVNKLLIAADKYGMDSLKMECANFLKSKLTVGNCIHCLVFSHVYRVPSLRLSVLDFMSIHSELVSTRKEWMDMMKDYPELCFVAIQAIAKKH